MIQRRKKQLRNELEALNHERVLLLTSTQKYSDVKTKMKQIIQDYKDHDSSELHMEKEDMVATDCRNRPTLEPNHLKAMCGLQTAARRNSPLLSIPDRFAGQLFRMSVGLQTRHRLQKKANRIVEKRMGFPHGSTSLQKVLKELCVKTN
mgnify:CR=1 FL=1